MTAITTDFVSKRLRTAAFVILGLLAAQALVSLSGCHEQPLPMGAYRAAAG